MGLNSSVNSSMLAMLSEMRSLACDQAMLGARLSEEKAKSRVKPLIEVTTMTVVSIEVTEDDVLSILR